MGTFLEFTACLALLACLVLQLLGCLMTCAVAWCTSLALPADCRAGMRGWCRSLWQNAFSLHMIPETWKAWLACHPAEAWLVSPADSAALLLMLLKKRYRTLVNAVLSMWPVLCRHVQGALHCPLALLY